MFEVNKSIVRRFVEEVVNRGNLGAVDELLSPQYHHHAPLMSGLSGGREDAKRLYALLHAGFPDLEVRILHLVAEGEQVALHSHWQGTHRGVFAGLAPSGCRLAFENLELLRLRQGLIVEHWSLLGYPQLLLYLHLQPAAAPQPPSAPRL
ncbi:ester cyclase [Meiothermus rufus]|uniref:ester cyclase n=1 Tax=Meiothermus rufus TaxID=604332 RepID=UPI00040CB823|nr:ester cyclase [Meiothermus rufus]